MRKTFCLLLITTFIVPLAAEPASGAGWDKSPLGRAKFGELWSGRPFKTADLAGKVVLVKSWAHW